MKKKFVSIRAFRRRYFTYYVGAIVYFLLSLLTFIFVRHFFYVERMVFPLDVLNLSVLMSLVLLLTGYFLLDGIRLYAVLKTMGFVVPFSDMMKLVFINIFVSNVTPLATGGGFAQIYFLHKFSVPIGVAVAATSMRTVIAACLIFIFAPLFIWLRPSDYREFFHPSLMVLMTGISGLYLLVFWVMVFKSVWLNRWLSRWFTLLGRLGWLSAKTISALNQRLSIEIESFSHGVLDFFNGHRVWRWLSVFATLLFLLSMFSFSLILLAAMGYHINIMNVLSYQTVVTFFTYFSPTPGGVGVAEGSYGLLFSSFVEAKHLMVLTLMWRVLTIYIGVLIGIAVFYTSVLRMAKEAQG